MHLRNCGHQQSRNIVEDTLVHPIGQNSSILFSHFVSAYFSSIDTIGVQRCLGFIGQ